jgi:hypothetical protein
MTRPIVFFLYSLSTAIIFWLMAPIAAPLVWSMWCGDGAWLNDAYQAVVVSGAVVIGMRAVVAGPRGRAIVGRIVGVEVRRVKARKAKLIGAGR